MAKDNRAETKAKTKKAKAKAARKHGLVRNKIYTDPKATARRSATAIGRNKAAVTSKRRVSSAQTREAAPWRNEISPEQIVAVRNQLQLTQEEFAKRIFATSKTVKNWEQGVAKANPQAAVLIQLIGRYPYLLHDAAESERRERVERQNAISDKLMAKYAGALAELAR